MKRLILMRFWQFWCQHRGASEFFFTNKLYFFVLDFFNRAFVICQFMRFADDDLPIHTYAPDKIAMMQPNLVWHAVISVEPPLSNPMCVSYQLWTVGRLNDIGSVGKRFITKTLSMRRDTTRWPLSWPSVWLVRLYHVSVDEHLPSAFALFEHTGKSTCLLSRSQFEMWWMVHQLDGPILIECCIIALVRHVVY